MDEVVEERELEQGTVLFRLGTRPRGVWLIVSGWVELVAASMGRKEIIATIGSEQCVGDGILLQRSVAPYTATVLMPGSAGFISAARFTRLIADDAEIARRWAAKLAAATARAQGRVVELLGENLQQQVARVLLHEGFNGTFPFPQDVCAGLLGASRPAVNQVLKDLEARSLIRLSYGRIEVLEKARVVQLAQSVRSGTH